MKRINLFRMALYDAFDVKHINESIDLDLLTSSFFEQDWDSQKAILKEIIIKNCFNKSIIRYCILDTGRESTICNWLLEDIESTYNKDVFILSVFSELFTILGFSTFQKDIINCIDDYNSMASIRVPKSIAFSPENFYKYIYDNIHNTKNEAYSFVVVKLLLKIIRDNFITLSGYKFPKNSWTPILIRLMEEKIPSLGQNFCKVTDLSIDLEHGIAFEQLLRAQFKDTSFLARIRNILFDIYEIKETII